MFPQSHLWMPRNLNVCSFQSWMIMPHSITDGYRSLEGTLWSRLPQQMLLTLDSGLWTSLAHWLPAIL